jgi:hypothetical protein
VHLKILHAEQVLVEATDALQEIAPPDRTGGLPDALQTKETQEVVTRSLIVI